MVTKTKKKTTPKKNLVIVESPAKAKTIEKYLGRNYKVMASVGHIRDLKKSSMSVDFENNYQPEYINIRGKGPLINDLKKEAKKETKKDTKKHTKETGNVKDSKDTAAKEESFIEKEAENAAAKEKTAVNEKKAPKEKAAETISTEKEAALNDHASKETSSKEGNSSRRSSEPVEVTEETKQAVETFLTDVFKVMGMEVQIKSDIDKDGVLCVDMAGDNMGIIIGKRGQTLDSLQYLANRVANKHQAGYVRVKLDTENYRVRREETLRHLAKNIAHKVKRNRKPIALEPMNPYERRIIHYSLQSDPYVTTHSEGEDPYRKVVVTLKR